MYKTEQERRSWVAQKEKEMKNVVVIERQKMKSKNKKEIINTWHEKVLVSFFIS